MYHTTASMPTAAAFIPRQMGLGAHERFVQDAIAAEPPLDHKTQTDEVAELVRLADAAALNATLGREAVASLTAENRTDRMTGIGNRLALHEHLETLTQNGGGDFAVLLADLDGFKEINDTHGHDAGDRCIIALAERLRVDDDVRAFRLGGDEFVVVYKPGEEHLSDDRRTGDDINGTINRLTASVESTPVDLDGTPVRLKVSMGGLWHDGTMTPEDIIHAADAISSGIKRQRYVEQFKQWAPEDQERALQVLAFAGKMGISMRNLATMLSAVAATEQQAT